MADTDTENSVQRALSRVGDEYVYGAEGPNQFDCSGLVDWSFSPDFPSIGRDTFAQIKAGQNISTANGGAARQRGDLLFPEMTHVAICLGGGMIVEAPHDGVPVHVVKDYISSPIAIRRLGPNNGDPGSGSVGYTPSGEGSTEDANFITDAFGLGSLYNAVKGTVDAISTFFHALEQPNFWKRILKIAVGSVMAIIGAIGVLDMVAHGAVSQKVTQYGGKAGSTVISTAKNSINTIAEGVE